VVSSLQAFRPNYVCTSHLSCVLHAQPISPSLLLIIQSVFSEAYRLWSSSPYFREECYIFLPGVYVVFYRYYILDSSFEAFMAVMFQDEVFCFATSCSVVVGYQRFRGPCSLHLQGERTRPRLELPCSYSYVLYHAEHVLYTFYVYVLSKISLIKPYS